MKKDQLVFTIMEAVRKQASTDDSGKFVHPQDVAFEIDMAYNTAVINFFSDPARIQNYDLDYFSKSYTAEIKENKATGDLYVDLPGQPMSLPGGQGIRTMRPENSYVQIVRISESEWMNLRNLEAFCCSPWPFAYPDLYNKRIIIQANRPEYKMMDNLVVKIIPKFSEFENTDEINSPDGDFNLAGMVLKIMGFRETDNSNDDGR